MIRVQNAIPSMPMTEYADEQIHPRPTPLKKGTAKDNGFPKRNRPQQKETKRKIRFPAKELRKIPKAESFVLELTKEEKRFEYKLPSEKKPLLKASVPASTPSTSDSDMKMKRVFL